MGMVALRGAWRLMPAVPLGLLLWASTAAGLPLPRLRSNPRRAERARQLVRPRLAPDPTDGGTLIDGFEFWWIGAEAPGAVPNSGVQTILQEVDAPPNGEGCFDCWVSEYLDNDRWGQVGFSACNEPGAPGVITTFYQVWDTTSPPGTLLIDGESQVVAPGLHTYAMDAEDGTTWEYSVDGSAFGLVDMGSATSSLPGAIAMLCEEGDGVPAPFVPDLVSAPVAMSVLQNGIWSGVPQGALYDSAGLSGVVGTLQDSSLASDAVRIGGDANTEASGTALWSGASTGFAPDAGPAGDFALAPPLLTLTSPVAGTTVSGTVTISGTLTAPVGGASSAQVAFFVEDGNGGNQQEFPLTTPPYTASWDTTLEPDEVFYVGLIAVDVLGRQTYADFAVTVDNRAGGTTGTSGGGSTGGTTAGTGSSTGGEASSSSGTGGSSGSTSAGSTGSTGVPEGTIRGTPTGASNARGCSSGGGLDAALAALIGAAWLLRRPKPRR